MRPEVPWRARPELESLRAYVPGKPAEELERQLGIAGAIKLASNESPLGPSPAAVTAMGAVLSGLHRYPDNRAHALRAALASRLQVDMDELCFGHGSNELVDLICRTFAGPRHHAVIGVPSFICYRLCLTAAGIATTEVPLRDGLYWDLDAVLAAVRPETRLCFIDNPNNPTSTHVPGADLREFLKALPDRVVAVIDEAYLQYAEGDDYLSAMSLRDSRQALIILRTFSKAYGLAAVRVGYGVAPAAMTSYLERVRLPFNVNAVAQAGALAALEDQAHLKAAVALNDTERPRLSAALENLGLVVAPSRANFLCVDLGRDAQPVYEALINQGVITRIIGPPMADALRISVGSAADNDRLLVAMAQIIG